jgi:hypothetical protein
MGEKVVVYPFGVDSLRLHYVKSLELIPSADLLSKSRAYSYCPVNYSVDGFDWYVYVEPCADVVLIAELLAHEASHISDALTYEWGGHADPTALVGEPRAYFIQSIVHEAPWFWTAAQPKPKPGDSSHD